MNNELKHYKKIASIKKSDGERLAVLTDDVKNDYHRENLAVIPKGTELLLDFGGDFGLYAIAGFDGVTHRVKINVEEFHKVKLL